MHNYLKGIQSLFAPRRHTPSYLTESEIEEAVWQGVGDTLRDAMTEYSETEEYKEALAEKTLAKEGEGD